MITDKQRKLTGNMGEEAVAKQLAAQGYAIIDRNWRCRSGELDIVAVKDGVIAFVEVKTRREGAMVSPLQAVGLQKQRRVISSALLYLAEHGCDLQPRFDVAAVTPLHGGYSVDYYPSAFSADGFFE